MYRPYHTSIRVAFGSDLGWGTDVFHGFPQSLQNICWTIPQWGHGIVSLLTATSSHQLKKPSNTLVGVRARFNTLALWILGSNLNSIFPEVHCGFLVLLLLCGRFLSDPMYEYMQMAWAVLILPTVFVWWLRCVAICLQLKLTICVLSAISPRKHTNRGMLTGTKQYGTRSWCCVVSSRLSIKK
jgi:hypothetical protein